MSITTNDGNDNMMKPNDGEEEKNTVELRKCDNTFASALWRYPNRPPPPSSSSSSSRMTILLLVFSITIPATFGWMVSSSPAASRIISCYDHRGRHLPRSVLFMSNSVEATTTSTTTSTTSPTTYSVPTKGSISDSNDDDDNNNNDLSMLPATPHSSIPSSSSSFLSLSLTELTTLLGGGSGRALACWDCFRLGMDPLWFHSKQETDIDQDHESTSSMLFEPLDATIELSSPSSSSSSDHHVHVQLQPWTRTQALEQMPSSRRSNMVLGQATRQVLSDHSTKLPEAVARLQQVTTSLDGTTKLLLQLRDGDDDNGDDHHSHHNNTTTSTTTSSSSSSTQNLIETVIIPWPERQSSTLCVSSQVGCRQACSFCATGRIMGRGRNLTADEILAQVYWAHKVTRLLRIVEPSPPPHQQRPHRDNNINNNINNNMDHNPANENPSPIDQLPSTSQTQTHQHQPYLYPIDNVVFMGMGEPADNAPNVMKAVSVLLDPLQCQLTPRKVTISTVAPTPQAFEWLSSTSSSMTSSDSATPPLPLVSSLAWSIHSSRDDIRKRLVPTTRYSMVELRQGLIQTLLRRPRKFRSILLSVTLLDHINDRDEDALHLIEFCQPILQQVPGVKLVVNVIPWNPFEPSDGIVTTTAGMAPNALAPPTWERILAFQALLMQDQLLCYIRTTRGDDTNAACGQLATKNSRNIRKA